MRRALRNPIRYSRAAVAVLASAVRVARLEKHSDLDGLVGQLTQARRFLGPVWDPELLASVAERLLPVLPPWRAGKCVRRSLLLLDLWSRCGLSPQLHLTVRTLPDGGREGHAWVTAPGRTGGREAEAVGFFPNKVSLKSYRDDM
jgi:hypothetical protein